MGELLILDDVLDALAGDTDATYYLFGRKNMIVPECEGGKTKYDLVFHLHKGRPQADWADIATRASLVIPVLAPQPGYVDEIGEIYKYYERDPTWNVIGINGDRLKLYLIDKMSETVLRIPKYPYARIARQALAERMPEKEEFLKDLASITEFVEKAYK